MERPPAKLLDRVRHRIRLKGYSIRTEQSYVSWIRRFILFHNKRHPQDMGKSEIEAFLTHLSVNRHVSPSTQNQAFNALLFLYRNVLEIEFPETINAYRSKRPARLPTVLTKAETIKIISMMTGFHQIMVKILYGSGLRAIECLRLRVKDLDFDMNEIIVRDGKGKKDHDLHPCSQSWWQRRKKSAGRRGITQLARLMYLHLTLTFPLSCINNMAKII